MSPFEGTPSVEPPASVSEQSPSQEEPDRVESEKKQGIVGRTVHAALSKENAVGMGVGFVARTALQAAVGGPIAAPVIGTVSAVASGIAREAHRAENIGNFSDYLRYQRGEVAYEKLAKKRKKLVDAAYSRVSRKRNSSLPERILNDVKQTAEAVGKKLKEQNELTKNEQLIEDWNRRMGISATPLPKRIFKIAKQTIKAVGKGLKEQEELRKQEKIIEDSDRRMGIRSTSLPERIVSGIKGAAKATGQKLEDATGLGHKIDEKVKEVKTRIIQTSGFTDISHRLEKLGQGVTQGVAKVIQTEAAQTVIHTARRVDEKVKDIATGQSRRLDRIDKIDRSEGNQNGDRLWRGSIQNISNQIRTLRSDGQPVDAEVVRGLLGPDMSDQELEETITQLEKIATDAFIAHAVAPKGQKRGEIDVQSDTYALAKDAMRIVKAYKGEGFESIHNSTRKRIAREAKGVVRRSVVAAGIKRAALAPITSYIGSEVSAAIRPYTDPILQPILQPILRPVQEAVATEINRVASSASHIVAPIVSMLSHGASETPLPLSHIPSVVENHTSIPASVTDISGVDSTPSAVSHGTGVNVTDPTPHAVVPEHTGSSKLASPAHIGPVSSEAATPPKVSLKLNVAEGSSLSETVQNAGLLTKDFNQPGSAREFYDRVIAPNASKFQGDEFARLTAALEKADTMGQYYQNNKSIFQNSWMEKLTTADEIKIGLKAPSPEVAVHDPRTPPLPPKEITIPKGSTLLSELNEKKILTDSDLSTPGSARDFYQKIILANPDSLKMSKQLSQLMEKSDESFYEFASKHPEVYKAISFVRPEVVYTIKPSTREMIVPSNPTEIDQLTHKSDASLPEPIRPPVASPGASPGASPVVQEANVTVLDPTASNVLELPPAIPRSVEFRHGESLLSALNRVDAFTDNEMSQLNSPGGGKIFFERIIKPNIGKGLVFTEEEGKTLQKLFDNPEATLYGVMYDPRLAYKLTKLTSLKEGQIWTIKPSAEQLHSLEVYEQKMAEIKLLNERKLADLKAMKELLDLRRATQLRILNEESAPAPEFTTDRGPLPIKLPEIPLTPTILRAYLDNDGHVPLGLAETQSVLKELTKEGLVPGDIDLVREVAQLKGISGVGTELANLMTDPRATDHGIMHSLRVFIDAHHLATDIATRSPYGLKLLTQMGYDDIFMHRQMLAVEGFDPESFQPRPGIQKFGESIYVVGGIHGDEKQEFIARLATPFLQRPNSFEYRAMQALEKITSLPAQTLSSLQKNRFYIPFMCESVTPDEKHVLLSKLIADAKLFGMYQESEVVKIYNDASSGNVDAYYQIEKILTKPGESARYLRAFKPSVDGNVLYQILRPDQNLDHGHVMGSIKDYGRYLGLVEYGEKSIPGVAKIGKISTSGPLIGDEMFTLPHKPALEMPTKLEKSVPIDEIFKSRYTDDIFVESPTGSVSRLTGAIQESLAMQSYPRGFVDILTTVENTQQTGDEFLKRVLGRNILTGGLQKIDELLGSNLTGDRVLGGGSTADMQLTEMLLGDPYSSSMTSLHGRRPDLYGRIDYLNYLMMKIRSPEVAVLPYETALANMSPVVGTTTDAIYQPNPSFETRDLRQLANKDALSKLTAKFETFLLARELQKTYSHDEVIAAYLNHVPMGGAGTLQGGQGREILGFQAASHVYFGKPIDQLTPAEQLVLIKIANAPTARSPLLSPEPNSLHPALNSAIMDIESKFIPGAKSDAEKEFWNKQIDVVRHMQFANTVPDEWKLETPNNLPPGTYSRFQSLLEGRLTHRDVAEVPGVGYVMQLEQPPVPPPPRTFGGGPLPQDFIEYKPVAPLNGLIGQRFSPTKAGYEILTDKGQRITVPTFAQAYQDESGKWITTKTIGVGVVAVDADTLEPIIDYDPSHSILGYAPPASTIKPFVASFLQSKGIDINTVRFPNNPGQYALDGSKLMVNNHSEYLDYVSQMTLAQALLDSSNVPFQYAMKEYLSQHPGGWAEFQEFMRHFGIPLRNLDGVILEKPSAYSAIGTDVVVNMEDYARAYALLANPERVFNDPNVVKSIKTITDHMTSDKSIKYLSADNPYPVTATTMNGKKVAYFAKSGTEGANSLLNAGFIRSDGKTVSIVTRVVNQNILFNAAGQPHATSGNLVQVLGVNQAWGSRTAAPISYLAAESIEKTYLHPEVIRVAPPSVVTHTPLAVSTPTAPIATPAVPPLHEVMPYVAPTLSSTPVIMYGGRGSDWSSTNPFAGVVKPLYTSHAVGSIDVNTAAREVVTALNQSPSAEKPILIGHSFGANVVMTAAYTELGKKSIAGLVLEDPAFATDPKYSDSIAGLGTVSDQTHILLILSKGRTISPDFLQNHKNITVSYHPTTDHSQLPSDPTVQQKIAEWTSQLKK